MNKSTWIWILVLIAFIAGGLYYRHVAQDVDSRGATRLMRALEDNDTDKMRELLEQTPDVHARDKAGHTALFYAARYAQDPLVLHKLVAAGADTLATDKHGYTPLMTAAQYNHSPRVILALTRYGRFLEPQTANKNKALAVAARHNTAEIIKILLVSGADPVMPTGQNVGNLLAENTLLTEQEKTDLRQVMLLLEILEARDKFRKENYPKTSEKNKPKMKGTDFKPIPPTPVEKEMQPMQEVTPIFPNKEQQTSSQPAAEVTSPVEPLLGTPADKPLVNLSEPAAANPTESSPEPTEPKTN